MKAELVTTGPKDPSGFLDALQGGESILINSPSTEQYVEPARSATPLFGLAANPFANTIAAAAIALAAGGPLTGSQRIYGTHRVVVTQATTVRYEFQQWFGDDYEYLDPVPTLISNAEVEDLKALLAIPYMGDRRR
jgi:hypothetical protein